MAQTASLPTAEPFRSQSVAMLKEHGIDGIISFRSMLLDIIERVEINKSYGKSDTLQVIRILKNYDFLREPQMELFKVRRKKPGKKAKAASPAA